MEREQSLILDQEDIIDLVHKVHHIKLKKPFKAITNGVFKIKARIDHEETTFEVIKSKRGAKHGYSSNGKI